MVIDLTEMRGVVVSPQTQVASVEGGATAGDVVAAAQPHGLTAATGTTGGVGMAGLTLGGGYGPLNGRFGLALDNLLGADVVLADGRQVTASPTSEPELYWALRGGGGNFGVATSLTSDFMRSRRSSPGSSSTPGPRPPRCGRSWTRSCTTDPTS